MRAPSFSSGSRKRRAVKLPSGVLCVLHAAIDLLESDAAFALRIQTSEPVLVAVCRMQRSLPDAMHRTGIEVATVCRSMRCSSATEAAAAVLAPYIFGQRKLSDVVKGMMQHEEPTEVVEPKEAQAAAVLASCLAGPPVMSQ
mmetsp:Transcript_23809/g.48375  ORF Transcript_23809/g.48375 Transcript_23809/m.48375 type:complete len:142 (+) Transcript_23809:79-504(+)